MPQSTSNQSGRNLEVRELVSESDWRLAFPIFHAMRPSLSQEGLLGRRETLQRDGYQLLGLWHNGHIVAVAGIQFLPHILRDTELRVHDLATDPNHRSSGFGAYLLAHIEGIAQHVGCSRVLLYSRNTNERAHMFYEREGYLRYGVEFCKEL